MAYTIAFFGSKPYDEASFNEKNKEYGFELRYYKGHLNKHNVILTQGVDAVCIFVNDTADTEVIRLLSAAAFPDSRSTVFHLFHVFTIVSIIMKKDHMCQPYRKNFAKFGAFARNCKISLIFRSSIGWL